jgi:hypothetical protein
MWLKIGYQSLFAPPLICSRKTRIAFLWNGGSSQRGLTQRTDLPPYRHPKLAERQRTRHTLSSATTKRSPWWPQQANDLQVLRSSRLCVHCGVRQGSSSRRDQLPATACSSGHTSGAAHDFVHRRCSHGEWLICTPFFWNINLRDIFLA